MINKEFFLKYQKQLVYLANTSFGRFIFQFEKMGHGLEKGKIKEIYPNCIVQYLEKNDNEIIKHAQIFGKNEYALKLSPWLFWLPTIAWKNSEGFELTLKPIMAIFLFSFLNYLSFKISKLPFIFGTVTDFNPQSGSGGGNVTVDGSLDLATTDTWSALRGNTTSNSNDKSATDDFIRVASTTGNQWLNIRRVIMTFDTSIITSGNNISAATMSIYANTTPSNNFTTVGTIGIYGATPAANNNLVNADYSQCGSTILSDITYDPDTYMAFQYNDFVFNASGISNISKTSVSKFSYRDATRDGPNNEQYQSLKSSKFPFYMADNGSNKPKLSVTYAAPVSSPALVIQRTPSASIRKINGTVYSNIKKINKTQSN